MKCSHCHALLHYAVSAPLWQEKDQHYCVVISSTIPCFCWDSAIFMLLCTTTAVRLYHTSSIVEAVACHILNAVPLPSHSEYSLCSCVRLCCSTSNDLPAKVHCASQLLLQTPLCDMSCCMPAVLCCEGICAVTLCHSTPILLWSLYSWAAQAMGPYGYTIWCALHAHACNINHL